MTIGLLSFAPVYLNGLLALFCVFTLPGLVFVRAISIPNFPQRLLVILVVSLAANHLIVVLIATLHLVPLQTYRLVVFALVASLACLAITDALGRKPPLGMGHKAAVLRASDAGWLALSLAIVCLAYFNIWKRGVPNVFGDTDVSMSWNSWAMIWSHGLFPTGSIGYPQFIPTIWAVTYIFTGSEEHYFSYYIYIVLLIAPLVVVSTCLNRTGWQWALLPVLTWVWFVAEVQEHWLRATLEEGFPDWTAAVAGLCGVALFIDNDPGSRFDRPKVVAALTSECLILLAAATKPIYALMAIAILIRICLDAVALLEGRHRTRFLIAATGLFAAFVLAYLSDYLHLVAYWVPYQPLSGLAERLSRAATFFNSSFSLPFRMVAFIGIALCPFLPRVRWLALPLFIGAWLWLDKASYDLRNLFGVLVVSVFIALFAAARTVIVAKSASAGPQWRTSDAVVVAVLMVVAVVSTNTLALDDAHLRQRFRTEHLNIGAGAELNQKLLDLLERGCFVLTAYDYFYTMPGFQSHLSQLQQFHSNWVLPAEITKAFAEKSGCTGILYPPAQTIEPVLAYVKAVSAERHYVSLAQGNGSELLGPGP
jgi:hypothetical protein